ncbi:MAG: DUF4907 domain-containing protein [Bacteroidetes bacterium]|nr:DUF4907 domain-containing protein [Bacteroidota bacterium]
MLPHLILIRNMSFSLSKIKKAIFTFVFVISYFVTNFVRTKSSITPYMSERKSILYIYVLFVGIVVILFCGCRDRNVEVEATDFTNSSSDKKTEIMEEEIDIPKEGLFAKSFYTEDMGWGYDLYKDGKPFLHQPHIPAINALMGFASEEDAIKVAQLMLDKVRNNIMPPGISLAELDSLNILIKK